MKKLVAVVLSLFIVVVAIILFDDGEKNMHDYAYVAQIAPSNVSYEWGTKSTVHFLSDGLKLQADLYLPKDVHNPVLIVGANGLGLTKNAGWSKLIESIVKEGWAFMIFDYRNLGGSEGLPRHLIRMDEQQRDFISALKFASHNISEVNQAKIGAIGFSLSGGHLLSIASKHDVLKKNDIPLSAIFLLAPITDGLDFLLHNSIPKFSLSQIKVVIFGIQDLILSLFGKICYVKYYATPDEPRLITGTTWLQNKKLVSEDEKSGIWQNKIAARIVFEFLFYRPIVNADVKIPTVILSSLGDEYISTQSCKRIHEKTPNSILDERPTGHLGYFSDEVSSVCRYLKEVLLP